MSRTLAFIQARMSSSRLPGKVLEPLQGLPLIVYMARRAARARRLDGVVVVTSTDRSDDPLVAAVAAAGIAVFRGDLNDVLLRYADAARAHPADVIVRLTGDCPLIDPGLIDAVIEAREVADADYASNCEPPTFPDGLDVECFTREALSRTVRDASLQSEREHVTLWMRSASAELGGLHRASHCGVVDLSALRLTVDYADDLQLVRRVLERLPADGDFDWFDVLRALSIAPGLVHLNKHPRNEGLAKSLATDRKFLR